MNKDGLISEVKAGLETARELADRGIQAGLPFVVRGAEVVADFTQSLIRKEGNTDMTAPLNLAKGQVLNLTKATGGLTKFVVHLGWDKGTDLDVSLIPLNSDGSKMVMPIIFYGNLEAAGVKHSGDLRDGGEEEISIDTSAVKFDKAMVVITSHSQKVVNGQTVPADPALFGAAAKPVATLLDDKGNKLVTCALNEDATLSTAIEFVLLEKRADGDWTFTSVVNPLGKSAFGLQEVVNKYPQA